MADIIEVGDTPSEIKITSSVVTKITLSELDMQISDVSQHMEEATQEAARLQDEKVRLEKLREDAIAAGVKEK